MATSAPKKLLDLVHVGCCSLEDVFKDSSFGRMLLIIAKAESYYKLCCVIRASHLPTSAVKL